jgi:hypothetical protein
LCDALRALASIPQVDGDHKSGLADLRDIVVISLLALKYAITVGLVDSVSHVGVGDSGLKLICENSCDGVGSVKRRAYAINGHLLADAIFVSCTGPKTGQVASYLYAHD